MRIYDKNIKYIRTHHEYITYTCWYSKSGITRIILCITLYTHCLINM